MIPLLRSKTAIPPLRPKQIERPRLLEHIYAGTQRALTLMIAPAGFGKTTLAAAWATNAKIPVAWLSLQPADHSADRFLSYLIQALQSISPHLGQTSLALLHSHSLDSALYALANDLSELKEDFAFILDDYHNVDNPATAEFLEFLLENRPVTFHLILTTRTIPSLSLIRLRALDQITEITAADLRFTAPEIRDFLENSMGVYLNEENLSRLDQSIEGWAVGLQLAGLALAQKPGDWRMPTGQVHIFEYLAQEVLRRESRSVQNFLINSALFDRFCIPLYEAVFSVSSDPLESTNASGLLSYVERANLFLVPLDSSANWFRYHALFTDFLRRQLSSEQAAPFYRAASQWFEQNGLLDDAIHYATHAGDFERAAHMLEDNYRNLLQRGEQTALLEWISAIPQNLMENHARLWLAKGWASVISFDSIEAGKCAEKAESLIHPGETGNPLHGEAKSLRILAGIFAGQTTVVDEISDVFILLAEQDDFLHSLLHFNLGLHYVLQGETSQAIESFSETLRLTVALNNPLVTIVAQVQTAETRQIRGALGLAERTFRQAIRDAKETLGEHTFLLGMPFVSYADLLREQNRFPEALQYAEQGIAYCQVWQPVASMDGLVALARLKAAQGEWDEAFSHLDHAMRIAETSISVLDDSFIAIHKIRLLLLRNDLIRASKFIQLYELEKNIPSLCYSIQEIAQLVLLRARVLELEINPALVSTCIDALTARMVESQRRERITPVIEALILRSYALHIATRHHEAAESLSQALTLGAQSNYLRIFADEGWRLLHLLEQYRSHLHAPHSYSDEILALMRGEAGRPLPSPQLSPMEDLTPLTRREMDILQLMADGKSNQEIALELILALNTVKKHVANILTKLQVSNRTQAVILARKSGWIK